MGDMGDVEAYALHEVRTAEGGEIGILKLPMAYSSSPVVEKGGHGEGSGTKEKESQSPAMDKQKVVDAKMKVASGGLSSSRDQYDHAGRKKGESLLISSYFKEQIKRVESTAESIVDAWNPIFAVGSPKDTASDYTSVEVDREASGVTHYGLWPREEGRGSTVAASEEDAESSGPIESLTGSRGTMTVSCDVSSDSLESDNGGDNNDAVDKVITVTDAVLNIGVLSTSPLMSGRKANANHDHNGGGDDEARLPSVSDIGSSYSPDRLDLSSNQPTSSASGDPPTERESHDPPEEEDQPRQGVPQNASRRAPLGMSGDTAVVEALSSSEDEEAERSRSSSSSSSLEGAAEEEGWSETSSGEEDISPRDGQYDFSSSSSNCSRDSVGCAPCTLGLNGGGCGGEGEGDNSGDNGVSCLTCDIPSLWEAVTAASATRAVRSRTLSASPLFLPPPDLRALERDSSPQISLDRRVNPQISLDRRVSPHIAAEQEASPDVDGPAHRGFWIRRYLRHIGIMRAAARVEPDREELEPPSPASGTHHVAEPVKRAIGDDSPTKKDTAPGFGVGSKALRGLEFFDSDGETDGNSTQSTRSSSDHGMARVGDIEEGKSREVGVVGDWSSRVVPGVVSSRDVAVAVRDILARAGEEQTMVLPCAPTDDEKFSYLKTGRLGFIPVALLSFLTMSVGMWLFTIAHSAFYWFGAPSTFLVIYLGCHYLGVAIWGKDFSPEKHAEIVQESERQGYEPSVDVFLPVCREPAYLLANTWKHVWALDYPNYRVHVLDDGDKAEVKALAEAFGFNYMVRPNRPSLKKAGNLRHAFAQTSGEAIAIFDADFCPRTDFLRETVPYLVHNASIGIVQTPQYFRYRKEQTWIEKGAGVTQEFFYRMVQVNQDRFNAAVCVGSCGVYRRSALQPFGGVAAVDHSEDMYTGFKMTEQGYKIKYVPLPLAMGTCPDDPQTFFMQQYRWAMGSATLVLRKDFWMSKISSVHKICFLNGMLYYTATAVMLFLGPMPFLLLVWIHADDVLWYHSGFMVPAILCAIILLPVWSTQRYGMACHRIRVLQCYAHLYAIKDRLMGRSAPWVPSGSSASREASATFKSSVRLLVIWNMLVTSLVLAGSIRSMTKHTWYHFMPAMVISLGSFFLNMSTLIFRRV